MLFICEENKSTFSHSKMSLYEYTLMVWPFVDQNADRSGGPEDPVRRTERAREEGHP